MCSSASAGTASIEGTVIGPNGRALAGSEVRAQRVDARAPALETRSDAKGHYTFGDIVAGSYTITAIVKGVASSSAIVKTKSGAHGRLDLDLRRNAAGKGTIANPAANPTPVDVSRMQRSLGGNINGMTFPGH